jgi:hypothetical protein
MDSMPLHPAIDPVAQRVQPATVARFAKGVADCLPTLPDGAGAKSRKMKFRLDAALVDLQALGAGKRQWTAGAIGLETRHRFARASKAALHLSSALHTDSLKPAGQFYKDLGRFLNELKRMHLTAASGDVLREFAQAEAVRMGQAAPGLDVRKSGAVLKSGIEVDAKGGLAGIANIGGGANRGNTFEVDPDTKLVYTNEAGVSASGGIGGGLGDLVAEGQVAVGFQDGNYIKSSNLVDGIRLDMNRLANKGSLIGRSASPRAMRVIRRWNQARNAATRVLLGQRHLGHPNAPLFLSDAKIAKGAFNTGVLHDMARELDRQLGGNALQTLVAQGYPHVETGMRQHRKHAAGLPLSPLRKALPVPDQSLSSARTAAGFGNRQLWFKAEGAVKLPAAPGGAGPAAFASGGAGLSHEWYAAERLRPAHRLLDVDYTRDYRETFRIHSALTQQLSTSPLLHLYRDVHDRVSPGMVPGVPLPPLREADEQVFGAHTSIGEPFRHSMQHPAASKLKAIETACSRLSDRYGLLVSRARELVSSPPRKLPLHLQVDMRHRQREAAVQLNGQFFGGAYPGGADAALRDPLRFVAQCYDAASLALGAAGTHLVIVKRQLQAGGSTVQGRQARRIVDAENAYKQAAQLIESVNLPIKEETLLRHGVLHAISPTHKTIAALDVKAGGGGLLRPVKAVAGILGKKPVPDVSNQAAQLSLATRARLEHVSKHNNSAKRGDHLELRLSAQGGAPVVGTALAAAFERAVGRAYPGVDFGQAVGRGELMRQLNGLLGDVADGATVVLGLRRFPGAGKTDFRTQYLRLQQEHSSGTDLGLPFGVASVNLKVNELTESPHVEVLGNDLGYHVLQFVTLQPLVKKQAEGASMKALFEADAYLKHKYFANGHAVTDIVKAYEEFVRNPATADGASHAHEFHRYAAKPKFIALAERAHDAGHFGPGKWAGQGVDVVATPAPAPMSVPIPLPPIDWERVNARLDASRSTDERLAFFMGEGRPLFDAYVDIVARYADLNNFAKSNHGFRVGLRDTA